MSTPSDEALVQWLNQKGVVVNPKIDIFHEFEVWNAVAATVPSRTLIVISVHLQTTGRGVMAKEDLAAGEAWLMNRSWRPR